MNGKGPQVRKGANLQAYWNNYDNIFRKKKEELSDKDIEEMKDDADTMSHSEFVKISKRNDN
jgi:hypothetical protein